MAIKIGINGMGRIGRMVVRAIIESNNKEQLVKAMKTLMSDKKLLNDKSIKSIRDSKKFNLKKMVKNHTTIYKSLINT